MFGGGGGGSPRGGVDTYFLLLRMVFPSHGIRWGWGGEVYYPSNHSWLDGRVGVRSAISGWASQPLLPEACRPGEGSESPANDPACPAGTYGMLLLLLWAVASAISFGAQVFAGVVSKGCQKRRGMLIVVRREGGGVFFCTVRLGALVCVGGGGVRGEGGIQFSSPGVIGSGFFFINHSFRNMESVRRCPLTTSFGFFLHQDTGIENTHINF